MRRVIWASGEGKSPNAYTSISAARSQREMTEVASDSRTGQFA
ncbi:hypothetical protein [Bacteroides sp.]